MPKSAQRQVTILMPQGLHLRPADMLVKTASKFTAKVELGRPDDHERFDAKSILSLMMIAATQGTPLVLFAEGDDCEEALAEIAQLFADGFGELEEPPAYHL
jgi:phosphotransferase system HPr (HPr) family protein